MSAFLGPIHHWVFNKIMFQNEITDNLIAFAKQKSLDIAPVLMDKYGVLENASLEDIIDTANIHGWLQERVSLVEYRLAASVKMILDAGVATKKELKDVFYEIGASKKSDKDLTATDAYRLLNDTLLDGMPCDRANELISESKSEVKWCRNVCVHEPYWNKVGIDIEIYYALRDSLIAGLFDGTDIEFIKQGEAQYLVKER